MRVAVVAAGAVCASLAMLPAAQAQRSGWGQPSCIASALPSARSQSQLIPAEIKGAPLAQVRSVVVRSLTWRRGETIKVCFHGGTRKAQDRVARIAREWMQYANVTFDFEQGGAPRICKSGTAADIRIAFQDNQGWWSVPGTLSRTQDPSMNLQFYGVDTPTLASGEPAAEPLMRATILHEFGHALGLLHEHQSPNANCDAEIDWPAAYKVGADMGWDQAQVDQNFRQLASSTSLNATKVDRKSIMHYSLPPVLFKRGKQSACYVADNLELSATDRTFIASVYPKDQAPVAVSGIPPATVTRSAAPRPAAADDRQALVKRYEELLKQGGIEPGRTRDLVAQFRKAATGK